MIESYRDLKVWQRAIQLSTATYRLTQNFPQSELYGLTNQLKRASVSVASNIAEGYGRGSRREYKQFLCIARGSNLELQTQLVIAGKLSFAEAASIKLVEELSAEVGKMLTALLKRL